MVGQKAKEEEDILTCVTKGFGLAVAAFAAFRGAEQTLATWRRSRRMTLYIYMVWAEWAASVGLAAISWGYIMDYIPASVWYFLAIGE